MADIFQVAVPGWRYQRPEDEALIHPGVEKLLLYVPGRDVGCPADPRERHFELSGDGLRAAIAYGEAITRPVSGANLEHFQRIFQGQ